MSKTPSARPYPYQDKHNPSFHRTGVKQKVTVVGRTTVDLGIKTTNFDVIVAKEQALDPYEVKITKNTGVRKGSFDIQIQENTARNVQGGLASAPTTPSTQATGAGITVWRVNLSHIIAMIGGNTFEQVATADYVIHDTTQYPSLDSLDSAVASLVLKRAANGTITLIVVKGAAAVTPAQVAPTDAEIQTAVGAGLQWLRLADCTINRTADTTVTQSQDNKVRHTSKDTLASVDVGFIAIAGASIE